MECPKLTLLGSLLSMPHDRHYWPSSSPLVMVLLIVMYQFLGNLDFASKSWRHHHEPSYKLLSSLLAVKWLVKVSLTWRSAGELLPHHHQWHHTPWWPPRPIKASTHVGSALESLVSLALAPCLRLFCLILTLVCLLFYLVLHISPLGTFFPKWCSKHLLKETTLE